MATMADIDRLAEAVKRLLAERRKMEKLSERARDAPLSRSQKTATDLNWQAMHVRKIEAEVHAIAVDCGLADLREPEHYADRVLRPDGWHKYAWTPPVPRAHAERNCQAILDSSPARPLAEREGT